MKDKDLPKWYNADVNDIMQSAYLEYLRKAKPEEHYFILLAGRYDDFPPNISEASPGAFMFKLVVHDSQMVADLIRTQMAILKDDLRKKGIIFMD